MNDEDLKRLEQRKNRKKKIFKLFASIIFISAVFFFVINAGYENIVGNKNPDGQDKELEHLDEIEKPTEDRIEETLTVLVGITDAGGSRTDALVLATLKGNELNLLNIPRDTLTDATRNNKKITAGYVLGIERTMKIVSDVVGFMPDKYVIASFNGLEEMIDMMDGVTIDVPFRMKYDDPTQDLHINLQEGEQVLTGEEAVHFLRWRKNNDGTGYSDGDLGRIEKTQDFISSVADEFLVPSTIFKVPKIISIVNDNIETDLSFKELTFLVNAAFDSIEISSFLLPGIDKYIGGISYYLPNEEETIALVNEHFNPNLTPIESLNLYELN